MLKKQKRPATAQILLLSFTLIFLPATLYTIFELGRLSEDEARVMQVYDRQMNGLLFSLNQYCWDIAATTAADIRESGDDGNTSPQQMTKRLKSLLEQNQIADAIFIRSNGETYLSAREHNFSVPAQEITRRLLEKGSAIPRMEKEARQNYLRLESMSFPGLLDEQLLCLYFVIPEKQGNVGIGGYFVNTSYFTREVLPRKFLEWHTEDVILGIKNSRSKELLFSSAEESDPNFESEKALWIFPDLKLMLGIPGETLLQAAAKRRQTNIYFLLGMYAVLTAGIFLIIRSMKKEMALAQMKSDFVANVSHELRTPLSLIRMFAETLELGRVRDEAKKQDYYRQISTESERLTRLINNILDFSRIESGRKTYALNPMQLADVIEQVLNNYRLHLEQHGFTVLVEIAADLPTVMADPEAVAQALINLLENAKKYSPNHKEIRIRLYREDNQLILSVNDSGVGISPDDQQKIFDKFYRVENSLVHTTKGAGLGLSLVDHIMRSHHGRVSVMSKSGQGSTFRLHFPINNKLSPEEN